MLISYKNGQGSIVLRVKILDSSSSAGAGLTGLTSGSSGLRISTIADNEASATAYTVAGSTIETITTLGTYAAPTATKCRFKEVDSTSHKGIYEIQIADDRFAVSSAKSIIVSVSGATNACECDVTIPLTVQDPYAAKVPATIAAGDLATDSITAASVKADAVTKIQSGLSTQSSLDAAVWAQTRFRFSMPEAVEAPESGSTVYRIGITTYNASGALTNTDSTPSVAAYYKDGTSAAALIGAVANDTTGVYHFDLTIASSITTPEYLRFVGTAAMSAVDIGMSDYTWVVDDANPDFGTSDRSDLQAIKAKTDNLPSDPADQSAVEAAISGRNDISVADILAGTADGVEISKIFEMMLAFMAGEVSVSSAGGVSTYTWKKRDGSTTSFTCLASESNGTRATTGSLS